MPTWEQLRASWPNSYRSFAADAEAEYRQAGKPALDLFEREFRSFLTELDLARGNLSRALRLVRTERDRETVGALLLRYQRIAAGAYFDARASGTPAPTRGSVEVGLAPVVVGGLVVGGLLFSAAAVIWGVAAYQYAVSLREETAVVSEELRLRDQASRDGRTLQPSTLPQKDNGAGGGVLVLVGGGFLAALGAVYLASRARAGV